MSAASSHLPSAGSACSTTSRFNPLARYPKRSDRLTTVRLSTSASWVWLLAVNSSNWRLRPARLPWIFALSAGDKRSRSLATTSAMRPRLVGLSHGYAP
ncbi:hypothetical protein D3C81_1755190 [compost metagenome]